MQQIKILTVKTFAEVSDGEIDIKLGLLKID